MVVGNGSAVPFSSLTTSEDPGLLLVHPQAPVDRTDSGRWVAKRVAGLAVADPVELTPSKPVTQRYDLWGDSDHVDRIEPGEYTFEGNMGLIEGDRSVQIPVSSTVTLEE